MKLTAQVNLFNTVSLQDKVFFTKHLSVMIKSEIPIGEAIDSLTTQSANPALKKVLKSVSESIFNGQSFESSLSKFPKVFDNFYVYMVKVGEESGTLEKNLEYLAQHLKKDSEFKKKVFSASLYPGIVVLTALGVGGGISMFVLPKLVDLFKSLDVTLPLSTQILISFAELMQNYGVFIFGGLILFLLFLRSLLLVPIVRIQWERLVLVMPVIGVFNQNVQMGQITRNWGVMLKSGLPISSALTTLIQTTPNLVFKEYISQIQKNIDKGKSISEVLTSGSFRFFPQIAIRMIEVGEKTGKLDESLVYLGDFFEEELDNSSKNLTTVLEPILLLIVGLMVAFLAMAIISPIYQFTGSIGR